MPTLGCPPAPSVGARHYIGSIGALDSARELAPLLRDRAAEGEAARTMPPDVVDKVRGAGLFHLAMPSGLGGPPCDPATIADVVEELSAADGSAGWTVMVGNSTSFVAWLERDVAAEILSVRSNALTASVFAPAGQALAGDGSTYTVTGRWSFASGAPHADWFVNGVVVADGEGPRRRDDGRLDWRFAVLPAADVEVLDTWHAAGLRGTGSHDVAVEGVRVPAEWVVAPLFSPAVADDTLFRLPFMSLILVFFAGFPLGVARRAMEEFSALAQAKSRRMDGLRMADDEAVQVEVGRLYGTLGAARAYVYEALDDLWGTVCAGDPPSKAQRARWSSAVGHAMRSGLLVVDTAFRLAGGGALYDSNPLQRCFRDLHAGAQHIAVSLAADRGVGRVALGLEPETILV
jgi:alkylation response protein AidB-like acyl-CoA dehydrogenase